MAAAAAVVAAVVAVAVAVVAAIGGDRTWDVDGDGHGDFATEAEARAYMVQVYLDDADPDATNPEYNLHPAGHH